MTRQVQTAKKISFPSSQILRAITKHYNQSGFTLSLAFMNIKIHFRIAGSSLDFLKIFSLTMVATACLMGSSYQILARQTKIADANGDWVSKIITQREYDFGEVQLGSSAKHSFELKNTTNDELKIESVAASCGCTVPKLKNMVIAPGDSEKVVVSLDTIRFRGKKKSTIHIRFEEPAEKEIQLSVWVDIRNLLVEPETVEFKQVGIGQSAKKKLLVSRGGSPSWKITDVKSTSPTLIPKVIGRTIKGSKVSYEVECSLTEDAPTTRQEKIIIETNDSNERSFSVPVLIEVAAPVQVSQQVVDFGELPFGSKKRLILRTQELSQITDLSVKGGGFSVTEPDPGKKKIHILEIVRESSEQQESKLLIRTDVSETSVTILLLSQATENPTGSSVELD